MSKFRINTEVNGEEYICQIDIEADECYAIDNYNVSVNGAILRFYEYTEVMNEKEIEDIDKAWSDFNEYARVKSKENYIKNKKMRG